jgi:D-glycero-alpha-D-manno-heptose-7-phosphate kinase
MIISRTPFRISLFGGGTDYPDWYREYGGAVVGTAIDKYCYISVRRLPPFFRHRTRIVYSKVELVRNVAKIRHPAVRAVLSDMGLEIGLEIHHDADLPASSGLGTSSSFAVGLINALHALQNRMIAKRELGRAAIRLEQEVLKENVGCQDQLWAAYGGLNRIDFLPDDTFTVTPVVLPEARRAELRSSIMLFFTGRPRLASDIARAQLDNMKRCRSQLRAIRDMVDAAIGILIDPNRPLRELGALLHESWMLKRELSNSISNGHIDDIYQAGLDGGALGGKLLGAGGGGFMVFLVDPENRDRLCQRLKRLIHVSVGFDNDGSRIVLYQPEGL